MSQDIKRKVNDILGAKMPRDLDSAGAAIWRDSQAIAFKLIEIIPKLESSNDDVMLASAERLASMLIGNLEDVEKRMALRDVEVDAFSPFIEGLKSFGAGLAPIAMAGAKVAAAALVNSLVSKSVEKIGEWE